MEDIKFKKLLYNEVTFAISIIAVISTFIFWITNPAQILSQRVSTLEQALEYQTETLHEIKEKLDRVDSSQTEVLQAIAALKAEHK